MSRPIIIFALILLVVAGFSQIPWGPEGAESGNSPLYAQSLQSSIAGISGQKEPIRALDGGGGGEVLITCELTCGPTCNSPTCGTTCVNTCESTCANTCSHVTCGSTCIPVTCDITCMATCQSTCANTCSQMTCAATCVISCSYTCSVNFINLIFFTAKSGPDRVDLFWSTATEIDNYCFLIRRSTDPEGEFAVIAQVQSHFINGNTDYTITDFDVQPGLTYYYTLADISLSGVETLHDIVASATPGSSGSTIWSQNYPNPFNANTTIRFTLPYPAIAKLEVFDARGRLVSTLIDGPRPGGAQEIGWTAVDAAGQGLAGGVYFYRLRAGEITKTEKMVLVK